MSLLIPLHIYDERLSICSEEFTKNKQETLAICAERAKVPNCSKREMSNNNSIHNSDTIKFMSCIKVC